MRAKFFYLGAIAFGGLLGWITASGWLAGAVAAEDPKPAPYKLDRTTLPIAEPQIPHSTVFDARNAKAPPRFQVKAPAGAPNVLIILLDDMGFGMSSAFGGPIHMPTVEKLAKGGLRYNQFHTTALCSPTRAALLTGRNHHMCNMGSVTETATSFPGQTGQRPNNVAPLAQMLRLNGYSTGAFGKSHETAAWEVSPSGPTDRWPTRSGFDKFYGFIGGETNQWAPMLYDGLTMTEPPKDPNYHFMNDMTNQAIGWMRYEKSLTPDKPFLLYFAPGATHAPHHAPQEWIAKYKGKFDTGWDKMREETLARQIQLGVVPAGTKLAKKPEAIKDWDTLTADEKKLFAHQMEVYAGFGEYADAEIQRVVDAVEELGQLDNTLIFYIVGDNGTSAEGGMNGLFNEMSYFNGVQESVEDILKHYDELGGPLSYGHFAAGWAVAGDAPFAWTKQVASDFGGTRNGMVVHWPKRIKAKGEIRSQFHHVIDIAPTVLEAAGLPEPRIVDSAKQEPIEGVSMLYTFDDAKAKSKRTTQYFEIFANRSIYHDGWLAGTVHRAAWEMVPRRPLANDKWELYDTRTDFSLTNDLSVKNPAKLKELQDLFLKEAVKYNVLPLDDRTLERTNAKLVGRPDLMGDRTSLTLYPGMVGMTENVFLNLKNKSHQITADVEIPAGGASGVILAQAGRFGGWSMYFKDGKPAYTYNFLGMERFTTAAKEPVAPGKAKIRFEFVYDGGGLGKGGIAKIYVNDDKVAEGRIDRTQGHFFSADETADVGKDDATPVSDDYKERDNSFTGKIQKVLVELVKQGQAIQTSPSQRLGAIAPIGVYMSRELTIPRKRGETSFARGLTLFAMTFTILAIIGIYVRVAPIASTIWLLFIVGLFWIHAKGGLRELLVDCVGAVAGRQFITYSTADTGAQELMFGFVLLGRRFVQLRVPSAQIASVEWSTVQAKGSRRRDLDDWTVWLRFDHSEPVTSPNASIVPGDERGIWILGATTRSDETQAFGRAFVQFLQDAGAKLVPGARPTAFVRADAITRRDTRE